MDKERRSRLKSIVSQARRAVEDDVRIQLRCLGIDENETKSVEKLPHLSDSDKELRAKIIKAIEKERAGDISYGEAFDRYARHVGFTYVNRIAALRAMEVRGLIKETVIRRDVYGGRSRREYELAEHEHISDPYESLKAGFIEASNEVSSEIRVLFDVSSEYSLFFLGHKALLDIITLLSENIPEEDWKEDDVIGWIYQYYNEATRVEFKKTKHRLKADDIPVVNQFYTPRWVVRALVDNTLGRLWLEMNGRCPKLGNQEDRSKERLENPSENRVEDFCSYLVPLSQEPSPREKKSVREIKVLDPACGSGHFLVYAFDVLFRMYQESEPETAVEEIPRLILENNLFGIDIDLRAVQLAALSLYLKAKSYNSLLKITKMNLVCADARITNGGIRKVFLDRFATDPELQRIFATIFENLEYTYEIGSLLKVRDPFEKLLDRRRDAGIQVVLVPRIEGQTAFSDGGKIGGQAKLHMKVAPDDSRDVAFQRETSLEQMLEVLKEFEREATEKRDMGTLLFATEAEKSIGILALLSEKYDVVLMNPPYGDMPSATKDYLRKHYPRTYFDYYAAFIEQTINLARQNGLIGMITSRTFMFLRWFETLRKDILWHDAIPELLLEFGLGVLDGSAVYTAGTVLRVLDSSSSSQTVPNRECTFCRLTFFETAQKEHAFASSLENISRGDNHPLWFRNSFGDFAKIPGINYAYWASVTLMGLFEKYPPLDRDVARVFNASKIADAKQGLATADDTRFTRYYWEVLSSSIGSGKKWISFAKGVDHGSFYIDFPRLLEWENEGYAMKNSGKAVIRNEKFYFREGVTWKVKSTRIRRFRHLPYGTIFDVKGSSLFFKDNTTIWPALSILNSSLSQFLMMTLTCALDWHVGYVSKLPWNSSAGSSVFLSNFSMEAHDLLREWDTGNEVSTIFSQTMVAASASWI